MPLFAVNFFSEVLGLSTRLMAILPQGAPPRGGFPVLYLLHGWSDDESIWQRRTAIERYVAPLNLAVIMPRVDLSYYQNMPTGMPYWTFISQELPQLCHQWFPISARRADHFAAGLSMGGYGALRLGLALPEMFFAVGSLSGAVDLQRLSQVKSSPIEAARWCAIFGKEGQPKREVGLVQLARKALSYGKVPHIYQCCGTEDFLYQDNLRFRDAARKLGLPLTYEEEPGQHEWGYWDLKIQHFLQWLCQLRPRLQTSQP